MRLRKAKGFSLIEVLMAVALLAVVTLGVVSNMPTAYRIITRGGKISTMTHLGYEKLEELKIQAKQNWNDTALTAGSYPATAAERLVSGYPDYSLTWVIADGPVAGRMKTITVTVGYLVHDSSGNPISPTPLEARTKTFKTMLAD